MYATNFNRGGQRGFCGARHPSITRNIGTLSSCLWKWRPVRMGQTSSYNPDVFAFVDEHAQLVEIEHSVDIDKVVQLLYTKSTTELARLGLALINLQVLEHHVTGQSAILLKLRPCLAGGSLPNTTLRTGDIVKLDGVANDHVIMPFDMESTHFISGTISSITGHELVVYISSQSGVPFGWENQCSITKLVMDVPYKRIFVALNSLENFATTRPPLHHIVFSNMVPTFLGASLADCDFANVSLCQLQREAVRLALTADDLALIHGPPGTGKTQVLVEVVRQLFRRDQRILVCGPSNVSVDNLVERLAAIPDISMVRVGNPARILPQAKQYSLESMAANCSTIGTEEDLSVNQLSSVLSDLALTSGSSGNSSCTSGRDIVQSSGVFDVVIVDEATQAIEGECWIAALKAPKLILAGDHFQLPPTVKSIDNSKKKTGKGLDCRLLQVTLFERMLRKHGGLAGCMLQMQYRMHADIMNVSSEALYESKLVAHDSAAAHTLSDLEHVEANAFTCAPLVLVDTTGCGMVESSEGFDGARDMGSGVDGADSKANSSEAQLALVHVKRLITAGVDAKDIAIITPYNAQVRLLRRMILEEHPLLEIGSVDGFQGRKKEAVILSMVRSNPNNDAGFLKDYRRMNVAVTRARRHLCIIADSSTVSTGDPFLQALFAHLKAKAFLCPPTSVSRP